MPDALNAKADEFETAEKRGIFTVSLIGCGLTGINYSLALAEAGFKVVCADADQSVVRRLSRGKMQLPDPAAAAKLRGFSRSERLSFTSDLKGAVGQSDVVLLTVPPKIDDKKGVDYLEIETSCKHVGSALRRGMLVIYGGVASFGLMGIIKELLENTSGLKVGADFGLAYNPLLMFDGERLAESLSNKELVVAANDKTSLTSASIFLATLSKKGIKQILDFKTAELALLFAVARRDVNVALSNELASFSENVGKDYIEMLNLADSEFQESHVPAAVGKAWSDEVYLLLETAENLNIKLGLTTLARQVNEKMARYSVGLVQDALRDCGKTLRRARITLLGAVEQRASGDNIAELLEAKGAKISLFDPLSPRNEGSSVQPHLGRGLNEAVEGADCLVILSADSQFKSLNLKSLRQLMKTPAAIVDLTRIVSAGEAEKEGFIYRGLGKGSEKK